MMHVKCIIWMGLNPCRAVDVQKIHVHVHVHVTIWSTVDKLLHFLVKQSHLHVYTL